MLAALQAKLGHLDLGADSGTKQKVLDELTAEGVANRIKQLMSSEESEWTYIYSWSCSYH